MHRDIAERWVTGMRSGLYTKGQGYLKRRIGTLILHCPFGILLDIALAEGSDEHGKLSRIVPKKCSLGAAEDYWEYDGTYAALPVAVANWAGCPDGYLINGIRVTVPDEIIADMNSRTSVDWFSPGEKVSVATVNDLTMVTLDEMAGFIELEFCQ